MVKENPAPVLLCLGLAPQNTPSDETLDAAGGTVLQDPICISACPLPSFGRSSWLPLIVSVTQQESANYLLQVGLG